MAEQFIVFPNIDPVLLDLGFIQVRWYGLMYLIGFIAAMWLGNRQARKPGSVWNEDMVSDLMFYGFLGVILGGRIGYVFFYQMPLFLNDPLYLFKIWQGGMSFHGGLIGVLAALGWIARKYQLTYLTVGDFVAPLVPIGLGAGRLGNFINGELWGRQTDLPFGVIFPDPAAGGVPRHPSQLYEFFFEGVVLFTILVLVARKPRATGVLSGIFMLGYGIFRFGIEFAREPDAHLGLLAGTLSMGQWLCMPMIIIGTLILLWAYQNKPDAASNNGVKHS